jgi:sec-independent protein translocase protein TatC
MPFLDHLEELRWRIVKSLAAIMIGLVASFSLVYNFKNEVMRTLIAPILPMLTDGKLVYTHPMGPFTVLMQVSGVLGIVLASPVVAYQVWCFLSPALAPRERKVIMPVMGFAALLFLVGIALAVYVFVPVTVDMMMKLEFESLKSMITVEEYFGFMFFICLAFGAVFEMPVVILILTALGLVTPQALGKGRRIAAIVSLVASMIVSPGDQVVGTLMLWVPVYGLYEFSIVVSWFVYRARKKREAAAAAAESIGAGASE